MADAAAADLRLAVVTPVVMSGGAGTRLWPISRADRPKQLHALSGERSLLRLTLDRLAAAPDLFGPAIVVCSAAHEAAVREEAAAGGGAAARLVLEPVGRNTAACAAVAASWVGELAGPDRLVLLAPADHLVASPNAFAEAVRRAVPAARAGRIVSLGVRPTHPETGYGYIRLGPPIDGVFEAAEFVEKPDLATATRYLEHGGYLWNGGYFLFRADRMVDAFALLAPDILAQARAAVAAGRPILGGGLALDPAAFAAARSDSIDYAVMEKAERIAVAPLDAGWSDIGSWRAVWEAAAKDGNGNVASGEVVLDGVRDSLVRAEGPLVAVIGLEGVSVIARPDAVLVMPLAEAQRCKAVVDELRGKGRLDLL